MSKIESILERKKLNTHIIKQHQHYNWGSRDTCKMGMGMNCDKIRQHNLQLLNYADKLNDLLSAFLEQNPDKQTYFEILQHMRGYFPSAYRTFERDFHMATAGDDT
jgi:hypothetical protein